MKFLSSSPSSSPSSTTTTTTTDTAYSSRPLTTMLRRLLCFNGLPHHPEMTSIELHNNPKGCFETDYDRDRAEPGLVAKLMGLESMPVFELANTQMKSDSISRIRSVDYDCTREKESHHRRVKTSLSFPEFPTFLVLEDFFVLSFENSEDGKRIGSKSRQRRTEKSKRRRRKREKQSAPEEMNKENREPEEISVRIIYNSSEKPTHEEDEEEEDEEEEDSVTKKTEETQCSLENSSPVSVLDFQESILDTNVPISDEDERTSTSNSRRRLLSEELENSHKLLPSPSDEKDLRETGRKSRRRYGYTRDYAEMWDRSCILVEEDMKESNWRYKNSWRCEGDSGDIGTECELQIFENLIFELVDQLVDDCSRR